MIRLIYILLIICSIMVSNKFNDTHNVSDILNTIISNYEKNTSFRLDIDDGKIKTALEVDVLWLGNQEYNRKTKIKFIEPLDFKNVHIWLWS